MLVVQCRCKHAEGVRGVAALEREDALTHFATTRWSLIQNGHVAGARSELKQHDSAAFIVHSCIHPVIEPPIRQSSHQRLAKLGFS